MGAGDAAVDFSGAVSGVRVDPDELLLLKQYECDAVSVFTRTLNAIDKRR